MPPGRGIHTGFGFLPAAAKKRKYNPVPKDATNTKFISYLRYDTG
jgi:hypothetical protein